MKTGRKLWLLFAVLAAILTGVGVSYGWFSQNAGMSTLVNILPPDDISIIPINGTSASEMIDLDLDFHEEWGDTKDADNRFHIARYVCVKSTNPIHRLEVVRTTNLNELSFRVFLTKLTDNGFTDPENPDPNYPDWELTGDYVNDPSPELDDPDNYRDGDTVEPHAYGKYWIQNGDISQNQNYGNYQVKNIESDPVHAKDEQTFYYTYYRLEIEWSEETKETDLFYIIAQNIA